LLDLFKRSRKSSKDTQQKGWGQDSSQKQLDSFHEAPQEKKSPPTWSASMIQLESEVTDELKAFESHVKEIKETSLKLEQLTKMLQSGEISENVHKLIMDELGNLLSKSVEEIFRLREMLELAKVKAKLEWTKEKIGLKDFESEEYHSLLQYDGYVKGHMDLLAPISTWESMISKIDAALSSLTIEEEASIIERHLSFVKEKFATETGSVEVQRVKALCQDRLNLISERWASVRRDKIEQAVNLELKASELKEDLKEAEARFSVGELDQRSFEYKVGALQASLKNVAKETSEIQSHIDDMDMRIFRCSELLREIP
jgi:hypothetical protein